MHENELVFNYSAKNGLAVEVQRSDFHSHNATIILLALQKNSTQTFHPQDMYNYHFTIEQRLD